MSKMIPSPFLSPKNLTVNFNFLGADYFKYLILAFLNHDSIAMIQIPTGDNPKLEPAIAALGEWPTDAVELIRWGRLAQKPLETEEDEQEFESGYSNK